MYFLFSGEGATDLGSGKSNAAISEGDDYEPGPMALLADQVARHRRGVSPLKEKCCGFVSETRLKTKAKELSPAGKKMRLPGVDVPRETGYYFKNARALASLANECAEKQKTVIVAVLFRDADGAASAGRGEWADKRQSMLDGFRVENFGRGVPMIPKPKSEAWLICALKDATPQQAAKLENRSGNDDSPNPLKQELHAHLKKRYPKNPAHDRERLNGLVQDGTIDHQKICMPSFIAFCDDLAKAISAE